MKGEQKLRDEICKLPRYEHPCGDDGICDCVVLSDVLAILSTPEPERGFDVRQLQLANQLVQPLRPDGFLEAQLICTSTEDEEDAETMFYAVGKHKASDAEELVRRWNTAGAASQSAPEESRSVQRRTALQKGEAMPTFVSPVESQHPSTSVQPPVEREALEKLVQNWCDEGCLHDDADVLLCSTCAERRYCAHQLERILKGEK
ncbi:Uncharacterised protein [uncultured archaeon]|nr:Uncharacterised protein [uncultured archaeon]